MEQGEDWSGLQGIGAVRATITVHDETTVFTRYFITSLKDVQEFADAVRKHWAIENKLHWCLDVIFCEDAARARKDNSPLNMNVLRKKCTFSCESSQIRQNQQKENDVQSESIPNLV